jgi:hypothetical protein
MNPKKNKAGNVDWVLLARDKVHWQALLNTAMKLWTPYMV